MEGRPMTDDVLQAIFNSDQDMYPAPLTYLHLQSWVSASPELSRVFYLHGSDASHEDGGTDLAGAVIVLPLKERAWRQLLSGTLQETDIDASTMFPPVQGQSCAVGLHVFHIERFSSQVKGFADTSLRYLQQTAEAKGWVVLGCSALTATNDGARTFARLGFEPTGYEELWVEQGDRIVLVPIFSRGDRENTAVEQRNHVVKGHARMTAKFSGSEGQ